MDTSAEKNLEQRLNRLGIYECDLTEQFVRSGGHGGQNVNKVATWRKEKEKGVKSSVCSQLALQI